MLMNNNSNLLITITDELGPNHAEIYRLISQEEQSMTTFGIECATGLTSDEVAECLGDLVRASYIRVYSKHNRPTAWETVKDIAKAC